LVRAVFLRAEAQMRSYFTLGRVFCVFFASLLGVVAPSTASGQSGASIAGVVTDESGGVLAGVTIEAASAALIERTRLVVTDGTGQYKIVSLPPGLYAVTMTLAGFRTFKRVGIELTGSFVAPVNAELKVGPLTTRSTSQPRRQSSMSRAPSCRRC
jgi:hypothetical protein